MERTEKPSRWLDWLLSLLAVGLTCFYPCVFLFSQNAGEARAADMLPFFGIFLATALPLLLVFGLVLRSVSRGGVMTCLTMLAVINFTLLSDGIKGKLPWFGSKYLLASLAVLLLALTILLLVKRPRMTAVCGILALTFGVLCVMSAALALPKVLKAASYQSASGEEPAGVTLSGEKRNVYYLLFDEYGGDENLRDYFGYHNSRFWMALEDRGFSVSRTSYNTESVWTDTLVPNMLNLDYVAGDDMPEKTRRTFLEDPLLVQIFRDNGYRVNLINHRAFLRLRGAAELTTGQIEDNISEYLFDRSIYCKLPYVKDKINNWMFRNYRDNYQGPLANAIDCLKGCAEAASGGPTLTVSYIQCPHAPFVYNADGSPRDVTDGTAWYWKDESLYPGQLQYINSVILETVDNIQRDDPEAVILLLSDHGARVPLHMVEQFGGPRFDAEAETSIMQNMLCAAYLPGQTVYIEGDTAINATRKALDAAFGTALGAIVPVTGYILDEKYNAKPDAERAG